MRWKKLKIIISLIILIQIGTGIYVVPNHVVLIRKNKNLNWQAEILLKSGEYVLSDWKIEKILKTLKESQWIQKGKKP